MSTKKIIESLSPNEIKILPYLEERELSKISKDSNLNEVSVLRALKYLENKEIVELSSKKTKIIELEVNGILYKKKGLPERRLLNTLKEKRILDFKEAKKLSSLSDEELKASIGVLKRKNMIGLKKDSCIQNLNT